MFLQNCGCALARRAMGLGAVLGALALVLPLLVFGLGEGEESQAVLPPEPTPVSSPAPSPAAGWDAAQTVRVLHAQTGGVEEMTMADYLSRVVAAEMPASFQPEALRAQAVCARTYSLWKMRAGSHGADGADLCDDSGCCQAYLAPEEAQQNWGENAQAYGEKIAAAVADTDGQVLTYEGEPIQAVFFSSSTSATEDAALRMRDALAKLNADMMKINPDYVVRITGGDDYGKAKLKYFISVSSPYPVIATTSKLLSTGADCKMTKLIVLDEMIGSMTEFKQILGRGTRLREKEGKNHFTVMDFRNVTRLFADPDWDGPLEIDEEFGTTKEQGGNLPPEGKAPGKDNPDEKLPTPIVDENGCKVRIIQKTVSIYDTDGKLLQQESIIDYTKENILGRYASLDNFIHQWSEQDKKEAIRDLLRQRGIDLEQIKEQQGMADVDDFDFICHVAFDRKPLTRRERANNVKKRDLLSKYSGAARQVLEALLDKYCNIGIYEIEKTEVLKLDPFLKMGKPAKIAGYFGGKQGYQKALKELEEELYTDEVI